jgi:hypothetical protein
VNVPEYFSRGFAREAKGEIDNFFTALAPWATAHPLTGSATILAYGFWSGALPRDSPPCSSFVVEQTGTHMVLNNGEHSQTVLRRNPRTLSDHHSILAGSRMAA